MALALLFMLALTRGPTPASSVLLVAAMLACQQVAISLHNDWCDRDLDAVAKPWRALAGGVVSAPLVARLAGALAVLSLALAALVGRREVALDALGLACGLAYNGWLKRTPWSWLPFAVAFPLLPLFGTLAVPRLAVGRWQVIALSAGMAPVAVALHLLDTLPDLAADEGFGLRGLAHTLGAARARRLAAGLVALGLAIASAGVAAAGARAPG